MVVTLTHTPPTACVFMEFFSNSVSLGVSAQIRFGAASGAGSGWFWRFRWVFLVPGSSGKVWCGFRAGCGRFRCGLRGFREVPGGGFRSGQFQEVAVRVPGWFWEPVQGSGLVPAGSANPWFFKIATSTVHVRCASPSSPLDAHTHTHTYTYTHCIDSKWSCAPCQGCRVAVVFNIFQPKTVTGKFKRKGNERNDRR